MNNELKKSCIYGWVSFVFLFKLKKIIVVETKRRRKHTYISTNQKTKTKAFINLLMLHERYRLSNAVSYVEERSKSIWRKLHKKMKTCERRDRNYINKSLYDVILEKNISSQEKCHWNISEWWSMMYKKLNRLWS